MGSFGDADDVVGVAVIPITDGGGDDDDDGAAVVDAPAPPPPPPPDKDKGPGAPSEVGCLRNRTFFGSSAGGGGGDATVATGAADSDDTGEDVKDGDASSMGDSSTLPPRGEDIGETGTPPSETTGPAGVVAVVTDTTKSANRIGGKRVSGVL